MGKTVVEPVRNKVRKTHRRRATPAPEQAAIQVCCEALRRIQEVATDALGPLNEDEAARVALEAVVPEFHSQEEMDAWWEQQPDADITVDPRLLESAKTSIRLSRLTIDGYNHLAKQKGLRSGQTLMKIVLGNYLAKNLPPDF